MTSLPDALASRARQAALEQRLRLLEAVWADACDGRRSVLATMLPRKLWPETPGGSDAGDGYAADLACLPGGLWRVTRDHLGRHPGRSLLQAPILAVFLPSLCRALLGQSLLLASMPVWWLGDRATAAMLAACPRRFSLRDGFDPAAPAVSLAGLPPGDRHCLQRRVDGAPARFVASLDMALPETRLGLAGLPVGECKDIIANRSS